jgi:excisionase family DNA binding protein
MPRSKKVALGSWIPKADATKALGIGERTLERIIACGEIRTAHRRVPGRKPLTVLHPDDVAKLKKETLAPKSVVPMVVKPQSRALVPRQIAPSLLTPGDAIPLTVKLFLTVPEAAYLSGLPAAYLYRLIASGELPARKTGGWRIKRADLEKL